MGACVRACVHACVRACVGVYFINVSVGVYRTRPVLYRKIFEVLLVAVDENVEASSFVHLRLDYGPVADASGVNDAHRYGRPPCSFHKVT